MIKLGLASLHALLLLFLFASNTFAQSTVAQNTESTKVPFCGELSEAECATLDAATDNMSGLTSGTGINQFKVYVENLPISEQELSVSVSTAYTFAITPEALTRLLLLNEMPLEELKADASTLGEAIRLPMLIDRDQVLTVEFSPEFVTYLGNALNTTIPSSLSFHLRVVNQVVYIRLADYSFLGLQSDRTPEWIGIQTRFLISNSIASALANPDLDVAAIQQQLVPPGAALANSIVYHVPAEQLAAYADFMQLNSRGLFDHNGELVSTYQLTWNIPRYVGGPLFAEQVGTHEFPSSTSRLYASTATLIFDGLTTQMNQSVGVEEPYIHSSDTEVRWAIGLPGGPPLAERTTIGFSRTIQNSNLNSVETIAIPQDVFVVPIDVIIAVSNLFRR